MPGSTWNVAAIASRDRGFACDVTDNLIETNEFRTAVGAGWTLLSDPCCRLQRDSPALRAVRFAVPSQVAAAVRRASFQPGRGKWQV